MRLVKTQGRGASEAQRTLSRLEQRAAVNTARAMPVVERIVQDVRKRGDPALRRYAAKLDGLTPRQPLEIGRDEIEQAWETLPRTLRSAMETAAKNIRDFARRQMPKEWRATARGLTTGQCVRPLGSVGCYVPSGRYPLPSTLLMTVIPAQVAGVERIVAVSAKPAKETLAAAALLGVSKFYRIGGAQAVAALAYGTESMARVDKIVGPGNWYVTAAKKLIAFDCAIDMLAGPTEIVVVSESGDPAGIAADLVAQAEHDPEALAVFVTTKDSLAREVAAEVKGRVKSNPVARASTAKNGLIFLAGSVDEAREIANRLAPEHLTVDANEDLQWVRNAGSVFVGRFSPQPMGDYVSGPNHTLPTGGAARARGGLSVMDFLKMITVQEYTPAGLERLGPAAIALAQAEGLSGHAEAVRARGSMADVLSQKAPEPRALVKRMREYHPPLGSRNGLRLDFNENTLACSPRVLAELGKIAAADLTKYPERESVERKVAQSLHLQAGQVLLTNGVDEAIHVLCQTFLDRGDELVLPMPTYAMYEVYGSATEATIRTVAPEEDFRFPLERLLEAITPRTRMIAIANPNSPTGAAARREQILKILECAPHAAVLVDEAYYHFFGETVIDLVGSIPNLIVARTFSKAYGLAGLRLGMLAAPVETQHWLRTMISPYSVNVLALACLPAALDDQAYLDWYVEEVKTARARMAARFTELGLPQWPSAANFLLVKIGVKHEEFVAALRRRGVLTRDRSSDPGCEGCVRITVGTCAQTEPALDAIEEVLHEIAWEKP